MNPLLELGLRGQSIWLDFITRRFMHEGKLARLIESDGLSGVTSNPTIFQKAIAGGSEYDASIEMMLKKDMSAQEIFDILAVEDIQEACDFFKPVYEKSKGADGFVSIEVNPHLAWNTQKTIDEARELHRRVGRPNVMIKIPGTKEGLPAVTQALAEGININVTLIFSLERYKEMLDAWLTGLESAAKARKKLSEIASVASFFVSRVDTMVDSLLEAKIDKARPADKRDLEALLGQAAIANAKSAYQLFQKTIVEPRFKALQAKGARHQRPLWASTSTKNPKYRDVLYVEELIGKHTVNTLPLPTLEAFRDHGRVRESLEENEAKPISILQGLEQAGIDMSQVTCKLEEEGVKAFVDSYDELILGIERKGQALKAAHR